MSAAPADLSPVFERERRFLFALCYRMTGSAADADDLVQETFARALLHPPPRTDVPWRPWLARVAVNLSRDELRRRKRRAYKGPWLPEPIDDAELVEPSYEPAETTGRYELLESVSYAFLIALEKLTPTQRAVVILRDVLEYTGAETAEALELSEANVRVLHHRARKALEAYDGARAPIAQTLDPRAQDTFARFMHCMVQRDVEGMKALLTDDALALNDGNGRFAARVPVLGANKVARFQAGIADLRGAPQRVELRRVNASFAVVGFYDGVADDDKFPRAFVAIPVFARDGRIRAIHTIVADAKLARLLRAP